MDLGLLGAFAGGVLTLLSPCSAMLLPAFFSYAFTGPTEIVARTGVFYLGLSATLVPLGILAGTLASFVNQHRFALVTAISFAVIVLGLVIAAGVRLPALPRAQSVDGTTTAAVFALGTVYGLTGVCAGPMLGAALTYAALGGNALYGGVTLLTFAAGMTAPMLVLALVWRRLPLARGLARPRELRIGPWRNTWTAVLGGLFTAAVGVLLLVTDGTTAIGGPLGATRQAHLESWTMRATAAVPEVVPLLVAAGLLAVVLWRRSRRSRDDPPPAGPGGAPRGEDEAGSSICQ
jgi:cytochrome c-type biogenesis protein